MASSESMASSDVRQELEASVNQAYITSPAGVDLLISAFLQALHSHKRSSVCTPFPTSLFSRDGDKDFTAVELAVQHFPAIQARGCSRTASYVNTLENIPFDSLKLLHWLLRCRYSVQLVANPILELPRDLFSKLQKGVAGASSSLLPDIVLKLQEAEVCAGINISTFEESKSKFGSIFAFHGTSAENLHSILRCGLLNLSNSSLQRNGAIFGEGIYLSTDPAVALGFCKPGKGWQHSHFGQRAKYLLLCEVAKGDKVLYSSSSNEASGRNTQANLGTYVIVQNSELVKLRYIFVYVESLSRSEHLSIEPHQFQVGFTRSSRVRGVRRMDRCKITVFIYAIVLLGIAYLNSMRGSLTTKGM